MKASEILTGEDGAVAGQGLGGVERGEDAGDARTGPEGGCVTGVPGKGGPEAVFEARAGRFGARRLRLERRALWAANLRLTLFLMAIALGLAVWREWLPRLALWGEIALIVLFVVTARWHDRVLRRVERARVHEEINRRAIHRLRRSFADIPVRTRAPCGAEHPYAADLDLFGARSLAQLLDDTATRVGESRLWQWLLLPGEIASLPGRQEAVRELAAAFDFREGLEAEGRLLSSRQRGATETGTAQEGADKVDPERLIRWAGGAVDPRPGRWRFLAFVLPPITIALWALWFFDVIAPPIWLLFFGVQIAIAIYFGRLASARFADAEGPGERLGSFHDLFAHIEGARFESPALKSCAERLRSSGDLPSVEMKRLSFALDLLRLRHQPLFHLPLAAIFLWDLFFAADLEAWRARCGGRIGEWFDALADIEAMSSLAGFAALDERPCWPELTDETCLMAEALAHPLIAPERCVPNDLSIAAGKGADLPAVLLVTGSNMAGKTTFLRAIGLNAVLALAGAPVRARAMRLGRIQVCSSMRVSDSLGEGLSLFHAEVRRMKAILDASEAGPVLFLLDEVLHGTNTAERQLASRAIVRALVERGAIGAIATHDVGLTDLETSLAGKALNVHFTDAIREGRLHFDYRLRPGVVATSNALWVIRQAGIELSELVAAMGVRQGGDAARE